MSQEILEADIAAYMSNQDDFNLELFVFRSVSSHGMEAVHGGSYFDAITGKNRQFDVRASMELSDGLGVFLAIECKNLSKAFPLIVSRVPRPEGDAYHQLIRTWDRKEAGEDFQESVQSEISRSPLYPVNAPVGKNTVQIKHDKQSSAGTPSYKAYDGETFEKWSQALSSANDFIEATRKQRPVSGKGDFFSAILPILVVSDDTLWVVDYSDSGHETPKLVEETTLYVDRGYDLKDGGLFTITHLHIFTKSGFTNFLATLRSPAANGLRDKIFGLNTRRD